ncbi:MAG: TonB-dependent receptor [Sphingomonadaceae bacterium]
MKIESTGFVGRRSLLFAGAAAIALSLPGAALAQDAGAEETPPAAEGNMIVVTATKREQTLQEIPVAVSVTSAETLERENIRDLQDLQTIIPSLRVTQLQSSANTNFIIRGFGNGANNAGIEPSVGVFVDGVYRSRTAAQINDLPDVARIEVLRGPQSTLFGKNASAGVISIVTKSPSFTPQGQIEASYGNLDAIVAKGFYSGPIGDNVAASIAAGFNKRDGYLRDIGTGNLTNERDRWFVRGQLLFDDGPIRVRVIGDYDQIDENCCGVVNVQSSAATAAIIAVGGQVTDPTRPFNNTTANNFDSTNRVDNYGISGQIDLDVGPGTLTSITALRRSILATNQDSDFSTADLIGRNFADTTLKTFTQEVRYSANLFDRVDLLLGGFYFDETVDQVNNIVYGQDFREYANLLIGGPVTSPPNDFAVDNIETTLGTLTGNPNRFLNQFFAPGQGLTEVYSLRNKAYSLFGQLDFEIVDGLTFTVGGNYTNDKKRLTANVVTTDVFSTLDLVALGNTAIFQQGLATQIGALLNLGRPANAAEIGGFAAGNPAAFAQVSAGVQAFANANQNNPAVNPLLALQPLQFLPPFVNVPNAVESGRTRDSDWSYTLRLAYDVNPNLNVYLSYATGFKASSFNLSRDSRPAAADGPALQAAGLTVPNLRFGSRFAGPEQAEVYEVGVKGNWGNYSANVAAFRQTIDGFQSNVFTGTGFALANAGEQRTWGVEFEGSAKPFDPLTINFAVTWLDPKFISFPASAIGDLSGTSPAGIPEWTVTLGGQWEQDLGNGDKLFLRSTYSYESKVQIVDGLPGFLNPGGQAAAIAAAAPFTRQVDDLSASITYAMDNGLELSLWGRNLLNDRYLLSLFDSVAQARAISSYPNQPRTYGVSGRFKF